MSVPDPNIRLSNTERETLIARLHAATEEGRLDLEEFAERSRQVYEAKTYAEVERLLADLPDEGRALAVPSRSRNAAAVPDLAFDLKHGHAKRTGAWTVPKRVTAKLKHSGVKLDCREAEFSAGDIEVDVELVHSRVTLVLPPHASAVDDGVRIEHSFVRNSCESAAAGPRFHLTGSLRHSHVSVRYERRFLWWRW